MTKEQKMLALLNSPSELPLAMRLEMIMALEESGLLDDVPWWKRVLRRVYGR